MRTSRVVIDLPSGKPQAFACEQAVIAESDAQGERFLAVFRDLFLGIKQDSQIFATIDGIEFEMSDDMMPLVGQRLGRQFDVVDLAAPPLLNTGPPDIRDLHAVTARAALETIGVVGPTLDIERLDQAAFAMDRYRDPMAEVAHTAHLKRTGLLQLFSRRRGHHRLDRNDPKVQQLARFDDVLADRRRQVASQTAAKPNELSRAGEVLLEIASARTGGIPVEMAATMSPREIERDAAQWVAQQHDRQMTPMIAEVCARHAKGIAVLGSIPVVLDGRRIDELLPGGDAIRWASRQYGDDLQFIVLVADDTNRRWVESAFESASVG